MTVRSIVAVSFEEAWRVIFSRQYPMKKQEIAVRYLVSPLETQIDSGHGGVAEIFRMAAQTLETFRRAHPFPYVHLPENFLYRHAVELYLKAMIITVHRARRLNYGQHPLERRALRASRLEVETVAQCAQRGDPLRLLQTTGTSQPQNRTGACSY